ncbi:MAG TPA: phage major capsid protein [Steroidobacteraceae bacterium]|jgi:HK97 family phage major capsid protein
MDENERLLAAIEKSNQAFEQFKARMDAKIAQDAARIETLEAKIYNRKGNATGELGGAGARDARFNDPETKSFTKWMRSGEADREVKALSIGDGPSGGFAVPKQIASAIESLMLLYSPMRQVSTVEPTQTADYHKLVGIPGTTGTAWVGETDARPATTNPTFADVAPPMGEIDANPQATQTMLDDVFFNAESWLAEQIANKFSSDEGLAFVLGNGIVKPKGLLTYPTSAAADDTRPFGTVQYVPTGASGGFLATSATVSPFDVLQQVLFSLKPQYRRQSNWLMSSNTLATMAQVKDSTGRFVLTPSQQAGFPPLLLGLPVQEDPFFPAIAANSFPIALMNPRAYLIVDRMPIRTLRDPFTNKPFVGFYTTKRVGGGVQNSEAVKFVKVATS